MCLILNFLLPKCYYQNIHLRNLSDKTMVEREEEQPVIKVTDRRKFNLDGSTREGVEIEPEKPKTETEASVPTIEKAPETIAGTAATAEIPNDAPLAEEAFDDEEDIPGAEDPASF